ncbi:unnamed protein product [Prunus armeniaca]|uniref:Uncharacterized protein n=1 Tax=Prunus armeniaca TaxID=36596 RepID=A0A6J5Y1S3_PRUAR|nr:unnamed protein product [Prunus armeniaca]
MWSGVSGPGAARGPRGAWPGARWGSGAQGGGGGGGAGGAVVRVAWVAGQGEEGWWGVGGGALNRGVAGGRPGKRGTENRAPQLARQGHKGRAAERGATGTGWGPNKKTGGGGKPRTRANEIAAHGQGATTRSGAARKFRRNAKCKMVVYIIIPSAVPPSLKNPCTYHDAPNLYFSDLVWSHGLILEEPLR